MKHILLTTITAVLLVGCGTTQPTEPLAAKAPDMSIQDAALYGSIKAVKEHLAAGADVNAKEKGGTPLHYAAGTGHKVIAVLLIAEGADVREELIGFTPLHFSAHWGRKEIVELLIAKGADVNRKTESGETPLDLAIKDNQSETATLLRKHGGKTGEELKAEGK